MLVERVLAYDWPLGGLLPRQLFWTPLRAKNSSPLSMAAGDCMHFLHLFTSAMAAGTEEKRSCPPTPQQRAPEDLDTLQRRPYFLGLVVALHGWRQLAFPVKP